LYLYF